MSRLPAPSIAAATASTACRAPGVCRAAIPFDTWLIEASTLSRIRDLYNQAGVFEKAHRLIDKHRERAEKIADEIEPEELRALLYYLIDSVLDHALPEPAALSTIE